MPIVLKSGSLNVLEPSRPVMGLRYVSIFCGATQMKVLLFVVQRVSFDASKLVAASVVSVTESGSGGW